MKFEKELAVFASEAGEKEEILSELGERLIEKGWVKEGFIQSIMDREKSFPTGLPTMPFGVAIPHTDGHMVNHPGIAFASLKKPVKFFAMGSDSVLVEVRLVFMLALKSPEDQLDMLQKLVALFQNPATVEKLANAKTLEELNRLVEGKA